MNHSSQTQTETDNTDSTKPNTDLISLREYEKSKLRIVIKELYFIRFQHHKQQNDQISAEYGKTKQKSERTMKSTPFTELL